MTFKPLLIQNICLFDDIKIHSQPIGCFTEILGNIIMKEQTIKTKRNLAEKNLRAAWTPHGSWWHSQG